MIQQLAFYWEEMEKKMALRAKWRVLRNIAHEQVV